MNKRQTKKREKMVRQYLSKHPQVKYRLIEDLSPKPLLQIKQDIVKLCTQTEARYCLYNMNEEELTERAKKELAECFARSKEFINCITVYKTVSPNDRHVLIFLGYLDLITPTGLDPDIPLITAPNIE